MSSKKDMRRPDLVVPYAEPGKDKKKDDASMTNTMNSTLPMIAMFTRNRMMGWASVLFALQGWLSEPPGHKQESGTPAIMTVVMALVAVGVTYVPLFLPPQPQKFRSSSTDPPAAAPLP